MIRTAFIIALVAVPAHANDIFVCNDDEGWEVTVAFTEEDGCILDNIDGEAAVEGDMMTCTTSNPDQTFRLAPDFEFAYEGEADVTLAPVEEKAVYQGYCTQS